MGLIGSISLYNVLAHSKFGYIASFCDPPKSVIKKVNWGQQVITCGPWQAFPSFFLKKLRDIGFSTEVLDLSLSSKASRFRNATQTLSNWNDVVEYHRQTRDLDDALAWPGQFVWLKDSCFTNILSAVDNIRDQHIILPTRPEKDKIQGFV